MRINSGVKSMLTLNDIINVGFRKSGFSGYRADDVESFVDKVKESYDELLKRNSSQEEQIEHLKSENQQSAEKLKILASKIEEYRSQEDEIKNALISAQKLGEASVREARHKAEIIVKDADLKAEHIVSDADHQIADKKKEYETIQKQVSDFRSKLMSLYREHLMLIGALPTYSKPSEPEPAPKEAEPALKPEPVPAKKEEKPVSKPEPEPTGKATVQQDQQPAAVVSPAPETQPKEPSFSVEISNFED